MKEFHYGQDQLTWSMALAIADGKRKATLTEATRIKIHQNAMTVDEIAQSDEIVYGVNTGFGPLCTTRINARDTRRLQENILKSHAVGVGDAIQPRLSKLMLVLKIHALAQGYSGVKVATVERLIWHLD